MVDTAAPIRPQGLAALGLAVSTPGSTAGTWSPLINGVLVASVNANALTVALKHVSGEDPSPELPVHIQFESVAGVFTIRTITAALSKTVAAASALATVSGKACILWVCAVDTAGVVSLQVYNALSRDAASTVIPLNESNVGATVYPDLAAGNGLITVASIYRVIGKLEWTNGLPTAGQWSAAPDITRIFRAGMKRPGEAVHAGGVSAATVVTGSTVLPYDDTIPQDDEGVSTGIGVNARPQSKANVLEVRYGIFCSYSVAATLTAALFQNGYAPALHANPVTIPSGDPIIEISGVHRQVADSSDFGVLVRVGGSTAGTVTINGAGGARKFGGVMKSWAAITEYQG